MRALVRQQVREPLLRARWTVARPAGAVALFSACLLALLPASAGAHDTWLETPALSNVAGSKGRISLALTTGALFPEAETPVAAASLVSRGCLTAGGRRVPLRSGEQTPSSLRLHADVRPGEAAATCWVQTEAFEVELPDELVPTYLREIAAPADVQATWAEAQRQGIAWQERYTKHARISLPLPPPPAPGAGRTAGSAAAHGPGDAAGAGMASAGPMALDIEIEGVGRLRAGQTLRFRVLRNGRPLAGQAVELRSDASRFGLWRRTDAEGRASVPLPWAGRWLLRATDLRPVPGRIGHWDSRFVTHAFSAGAADPASPPRHEPPADAPRSTNDRAPALAPDRAPANAPGMAQPNSPSMPNARSTNHQSASTTMQAEPPTSTARR